MNGINPFVVSLVEDEEFYPSSDGQPMAETDVHVLLMANLLSMLRHWFKKNGDVYVAANMFLYYREGHPELRTAPDVMVIKGVDGRRRRRSFKTWEEKASPCFVLELTSKKTAKEDQVKKKQLYQALGIQEYFLFDPLHDYLPRQLLGNELVKGKYQAMEAEEDESLVSKELELRFIPAEANLVVVDYRTNEPLLNPAEAYESLERERRKNADLAAELKRLKRKKK
jgi:Uma2 family endonuclease